ncbi:DUF2867 domain-containing protein [Mycobacterium sp. CBMA271]|uniref:hypothetical protein n=1 Tax=unclassified Mycobacteroides TaxID=2618759 RepID=UPI0012DFDDE8|nr:MULTISPECIES: hypothetical protein [unclassified Mycobacteroides]MUM17806.1 hypothetical protein [Mycobacteroides sp. CBMA 326]MUM20377.1 DUF2867 domain-containing protein [Mycobacteroides sp. CBMA 271]
MEHLSYIDEHAIRIDAPRAQVWENLRRYADAMLRSAERSPLGALLGTRPRAGFAVNEVEPGQHLSLVGRHRFSRYELVFELGETKDGGTQLRAQTYADFPGLRGRIYRALVIGTRGHVLATNHILRSVKRLTVGVG